MMIPSRLRWRALAASTIYKASFEKPSAPLEEGSSDAAATAGSGGNPLAEFYDNIDDDEEKDIRCEVETYLEMRRAKENISPESWWKANYHLFPRGLDTMAMNYFAIPGTSLPSERLFSRTGDIITKKRSRLVEDTTVPAALIKDWTGGTEVEMWEVTDEIKSEFLGIEDEAELMAVFTAEKEVEGIWGRSVDGGGGLPKVPLL